MQCKRHIRAAERRCRASLDRDVAGRDAAFGYGRYDLNVTHRHVRTLGPGVP